MAVRPLTNQDAIGGVSAVNPQAQGDFQKYIDASFNNAKTRLDPILGAQRNAYNQQMVNMGLPVGGEAYNKAFQQLDQNQNDAWESAAFGAMGFGLDAQNQDFAQSNARSALANALLQSKWGTDLGIYNTDVNKEIADQELGYKYAGLGEDARQFDMGFGEDQRQFNLGFGEDQRQWDQGLDQRNYEFDSTLDNRQYEFDRGLDFQYYDTDNRYDYMWDRASQDDYRWEAGQDRQDFYDNQQVENLDFAKLMQLLGLGQGPGVYTQDPTSAYNTQLGSMTNQQNNQFGLIDRLFFSGG